MSVKSIDFTPVDDAVVIEIERIEEESSGGISLPEEYRERKQMSIVEGILVKTGSLAFYDLINNQTELSKNSGEQIYPEIGNKVYFKRHSGILHSDKENKREFRIIRDQDIYAFEKCEVKENL